jgi:predicted ATPase
LVIGRNGSGKSSFAEALEILVTGSLRRWEELDSRAGCPCACSIRERDGQPSSKTLRSQSASVPAPKGLSIEKVV